MRISDWSSDVCSSDLPVAAGRIGQIVEPILFERIFQRRDISLRLGHHRLVLARQDVDHHDRGEQADDEDHDHQLGQGEAALVALAPAVSGPRRSEEHTSELQSLMRISYAVFCLKKKNITYDSTSTTT